MGSLGTLPLAYALIYFGGFWALMAAAAVLFVLGVRATEAVIEESGDSDPSKVVIDETVGQLLSFSFVAYMAPEYLTGMSSLLYYAAGFIFFRFFDILKMGPVKYADTKKGARRLLKSETADLFAKNTDFFDAVFDTADNVVQIFLSQAFEISKLAVNHGL